MYEGIGVSVEREYTYSHLRLMNYDEVHLSNISSDFFFNKIVEKNFL